MRFLTWVFYFKFKILFEICPLAASVLTIESEEKKFDLSVYCC